MFTTITLARVTSRGIDGYALTEEERTVILRSRHPLNERKFGAFGRWFDEQRDNDNPWHIVEIVEYPDRHTFEFVTGGFPDFAAPELPRA